MTVVGINMDIKSNILQRVRNARLTVALHITIALQSTINTNAERSTI